MREGRTRRGAQPGLTLLELLIVVALVLALAAISLPALTSSFEQRAFTSAAEQTESQLLLARAHAQTTGRLVEVRYVAAGARVEARFVDPGGDLGDDGDRDELTASPETDGLDPETTITEHWAYRPLPGGVRLSRTAPEQAAGNGDPAAPTEFEWSFDPDADLEETPVLRLAVFLPDGSAIGTSPVWLSDGNGRWGRLEINPWTGLPRFEASALDREEPDDADEDEDEDETDDDRSEEPMPEVDLPGADGPTDGPGTEPADGSPGDDGGRPASRSTGGEGP